MAIKFSQFVVETNKANVNYIVGWDGAENVQITPADLLSGYPTFTGSTGQVAFFDTASSIGGDNDLFFDNTNKRLGIGTTSPDRNLVVSGVGSSASTYIKILGDTSQEAILELHADNDAPSDRWRIAASNSAKLQFRSNGSNVLSITSSENVGIGTTTPSSKLSVDGTLNATSISQLGSSGANVFLTSSSAGNVGIGTAGPVAKLHVYQNNSDDDTTAGVTIEQDGTGDATLSFLLTSVRRWKLGIDNNDLDKFKISDSTNLASSNKLTIDVGGNVGIGTSSPTTKLQVAGNSTYISVKNTSNYRAVDLGADSSGDGQIIMRDSSNNNKILFYAEANSNNYINNGGNVGIGTSSPSQRLEVAGNIQATGTRSISSLFDANHYMRIESNSSGGILKGTDGGVITTLVRTYGDSYFNSGNVGIGTTSPATWKLTVDSDDVYAASFDTSNNTGVTINGNNATAAQLLGYSNSASTYNDLDIRSNSTAGSGIYIDGSLGNVGIGTTSPNAKLQVGGDLHVYDEVGNTDARVMLSTGTLNVTTVKIASNGSSFFNAGNIGIGTNSPASKLEVDGGDIEIDDSASGLILRSPDGTRYRVTVANGGTLSVAAV